MRIWAGTDGDDGDGDNDDDDAAMVMVIIVPEALRQVGRLHQR
jgi:hypothetical protein